jgi:hypothetical protein
MTSLRSSIDALAAEFAAAIVAAVRGSTLAEILETGVPHRGPGRPRNTETSVAPPPPPAPALKRGRGRPRKSDGPATKTAPAAKRGRGRPRSTDRGANLNAIVAYVKAHPRTRGETARKALGLEKHVWSTTVAQAVKEGKLKKEGDRRATTYWVA